jgi:hypothetical protein
MTIDNRPLNQRLDALDNVNTELDKTTHNINPDENATTAIDSTVPYTTAGDQIPDDTSMLPQDSGFTGEKVDTAGLKDILPKVIRKVIGGTVKDAEPIIDRLAKPIIKTGKELEQTKQFIVIPEAPKQKVEQVLKQTESIYAPLESKNVAAKIGNDITDESQFVQYKDAVSNAYDLKSYEKMSYKDALTDITQPKVFIKRDGMTIKEFKTQSEADKWLNSQSDKTGLNAVTEQVYDEKFISRLLDNKIITEANPADIGKLPYLMRDVSERNESILKKYFTAKASDPEGIETKDLLVQFKIGLALEGNLTRSATGRIRDVSRSLGILNQSYKLSKTSPERAKLLQDIIDQSGGSTSIDDIGQHYLALQSRADRASMAEQTLLGSVKDMWYATWVNGLLSSPITHLKNIAGNATFGMWQIPERLTASIIGKGRTTLGIGSKDYIHVNEVMDQASAMATGLTDAFRLSAKAFKTNMPSDPITKLEMGRVGRDDFNLNFGDSTFGKSMSDAIKYAGNVITIPGRGLMAEDEFFKSIGYRMELSALTRREANKKYDELIASGIDETTAKTQTIAYHADLLANPTDDIHEAATKQARVVTFTNELEGGLRNMQSLINTEIKGFPYLKLFFPFVRTPANIAKETMSRTPLALLSPSIRKSIMAGGIEGDMAMAKITLNSGAMYGLYQHTLGGNQTGAGPFRYEDQEALKATGWQPFSWVFNKSDVDPEALAKFEDITNVSVGPDKIYVSYESLGPLASLIGMSSSSAEYAMANPDDDGLEKLAMAGAVSLYDYMSNLDMLQGIGNIHEMFSSDSKDRPGLAYDILSKLSKKGSEFLIGGSPAGAYSSLSAVWERYNNPERSNVMRQELGTKAESGIVGAIGDGYWQTLAQYKSRNPLLSDSLPPLLDPLTGETKHVGKGNFYETFNPFKRSDGQDAPGYATLLEYGVPSYVPKKSKDGVMLSAEQYNRWIELATNDGALEQRVVKLGELYKKIKGMDMSVAQTAISKEISDAYGTAWNQLTKEDVDLTMALEDVADSKKETGIYKR